MPDSRMCRVNGMWAVALAAGIVALILSPGHSALAGDPTTQPAVVWKTTDVSIGQENAKEIAGQPAGIFVASLDSIEPAIYGDMSENYTAAVDHWFPGGYGAVIGHVTTVYPDEASFEVISYGRTGAAIHITLRHKLTGGKKADPRRSTPDLTEKSPGKCLYFTALLPHNLPDGHYTVTATIVEADGHRADKGPAELRCEYELPQPPPDYNVEFRRLSHLSDEDLLKQYIDSGTALKGTGLEPSETGDLIQAAYPYSNPRRVRWETAHKALVARGEKLAPLLVELLKKEMLRNARLAPAEREYAFGFAHDVIEMLGQIHSANAAPVLVDVLDGFGGKGSVNLRQDALFALESVTDVAWIRPSWGGRNSFALPGPGAEPETADYEDKHRAAQYTRCAVKYRAWLAAHPGDSAGYHALARARALELLKTDDLADVYLAAEFLSDACSRPGEDTSAVLLPRIAQILDECKRKPGDKEHISPQFVWRGKDLAEPIADWMGLLAGFGPKARQFVPSIVRIDRELGEDDDINDVASIGGEEAMSHLVERLPVYRARCDANKLDRNDRWYRSDLKYELHRMVVNYQRCRWAIDHWSGRSFEKDSDIADWWKANGGKSQEQWLADALEVTAARADAADPESEFLIRILLPHLPQVEGEQPWESPLFHSDSDYRVLPIAPFRVKWLREHHAALVYDAQNGCFRVRGAGEPARSNRGSVLVPLR